MEQVILDELNCLVRMGSAVSRDLKGVDGSSDKPTDVPLLSS